MPIEGFPDPQIHRICVRCRKWFWPDEGVDYVLPRARPAGVQLAREIAGIQAPVRFMCKGCARARRRVRIVIFGTLLSLILALLVLKWFGVF
jgi:hypothetical protein